jgi:hypothetical protein
MLLLRTDTEALLLHVDMSALLHRIIASESFNNYPRQKDNRFSSSNVSLKIHDFAPFSQ